MYISAIDISNSQISDTIPIWSWNFSSDLYTLNVSSNKIRGKYSHVHDTIGLIDLSSNYFDGPLPAISNECRFINLSKNKFSGTLLSLRIVEDNFTVGETVGPTFLDISGLLLGSMKLMAQ